MRKILMTSMMILLMGTVVYAADNNFITLHASSPSPSGIFSKVIMPKSAIAIGSPCPPGAYFTDVNDRPGHCPAGGTYDSPLNPWKESTSTIYPTLGAGQNVVIGGTATDTEGDLAVVGGDGIVVRGTYGSGDAYTTTGEQTAMFFNPESGSFRAGVVDNFRPDSWDTIGDGSVVSGGINNKAEGLTATVGGGRGNTANGVRATVGGGLGNKVESNFATIAGGINNNIFDDVANNRDGYQATIAGGASNQANGPQATVGGGVSNISGTDTAGSTTVSGGSQNEVLATGGVIPGGLFNKVDTTATRSFAAGAGINNQGADSFVWGHSNNYSPAPPIGNRLDVNLPNTFAIVTGDFVVEQGDVGIGNTSPSEALDVTGNALVSGNTAVGGTLSAGTTSINGVMNLTPQNPAPACATPGFYVEDIANDLCYCNGGGTWTKLTGGAGNCNL